MLELVVLTLAAGLLIKVYLHRKWSFLKRLNIPHDPPSLSNLGNRNLFSGDYFSKELENKRKYGAVWGYYSLFTPRIVIHDHDMAQQVCISHFSTFPNRLEHGVQLNGKELNNGLLAVNDEKWKRIRTALNPAFSPMKLRQMSWLINRSADNALKVFEGNIKAKSGHFVAKTVFSRLSLDIICSAAFSLDVNSQDEAKEEPEISREVKNLLSSGFDGLANFVVFAFPFLEPFFIWASGHKGHIVYLRRLCEKIKMEKLSGVEHSQADLMQFMLNSRVGESEMKNTLKGLSDIEILGNAMSMVMAGYDTTAIAMTYLAYNLAFHPEIQQKLQSEIDEMYDMGKTPDFDSVNSLKYLDLCVNESLRLYCPVPRVLRTAKHDIVVNGITIPQGVMVAFSVYAFCHDPDYWSEPMSFKPERMEGRSGFHPMLYAPFGAGPRRCIGHKFALAEIKIVFCKILRYFSIRPSADTPKPPLKLAFGVATRPKINFNLHVLKRRELPF